VPDLPPPPAPPPSPGERLRELFGALGPVRERWAALLGSTAAVVVLVAAAAIGLRPAPEPPELSLPRAEPQAPDAAPAGAAAPAPAAAGEAGEIYVHAAGAVARPGVYRLAAGARVADVVAAAGGPAPDADLDRLNLAAKVEDGARVRVPRRGEVLPEDDAGLATGAEADRPLDLNAATAAELERLPGIGPATASAIVEYRRQHGRFRSVEQLLEVRGIGPAKLAALRARVRV
jgi:competence protein ComEA